MIVKMIVKMIVMNAVAIVWTTLYATEGKPSRLS